MCHSLKVCAVSIFNEFTALLSGSGKPVKWFNACSWHMHAYFLLPQQLVALGLLACNIEFLSEQNAVRLCLSHAVSFVNYMRTL